jgi:hypothetical protein
MCLFLQKMSACFSAEDLPASVALAEPVVGMALYWTALEAAMFQVKLLKELCMLKRIGNCVWW